MNTTIKAEPHPIDDDAEWLVIESSAGHTRTAVRVPKGDATEIAERVEAYSDLERKWPEYPKGDFTPKMPIGVAEIDAKVWSQRLADRYECPYCGKVLPIRIQETRRVILWCGHVVSMEDLQSCKVARDDTNDSATAIPEKVEPAEFLVPRFKCRVCGAGLRVRSVEQRGATLECSHVVCHGDLGAPIWPAEPAETDPGNAEERSARGLLGQLAFCGHPVACVDEEGDCVWCRDMDKLKGAVEERL